MPALVIALAIAYCCALNHPHHVIRFRSLDSSTSRDSRRDELAPDAIDALRPMLDRVADGATVALPGTKHRCRMTGAMGRHRALLLTINAGNDPVASIGIAPSPGASDELWREWIGRSADDRTPRAPWCVLQRLPGLSLHQDLAPWLDVFGRSCAWAWIDAHS